MSYLFLVTIGPVQDFIAAARRPRDLWAGSQLLSNLSRAAALALRDKHEADLIFPATTDDNRDLEQHDVVNRILAIVTTNDPQQVGAAVEQAVRERLRALCKATFDDEKRITWPQDQSRNHRSNAEAQVADLIEIYWAAVKRTDDYRQDRDKLEAALAARKNTRNFVQPEWADYVPKSSIDGLRESVIPEDDYPRRDESAEQRQQKALKLFQHFGAGPAERLSGVDLLKRHYQPRSAEANFPSTSHFAALPLLVRCEGTRTNGLADYLTTLRRRYPEDPGNRRLESLKLDDRFKKLNVLDNYDASILFTSRLDEDLEGEALKEARVALANYRRDALCGSEPEPYYALLHADGDFMGKTIDSLAAQGIPAHQRFSQALDTFASGVREIVEQHHSGALVYSGGDDVLAFLPLHTVVQCAKDLAARFNERLAEFTYFDEGLQRHVSPSLSVGIAICHHLEPLSDALNLAREAEKIAKRVPDKNALAITLSKRSGVDRTIRGSWASSFYQRLVDLTTWHRADAIPDSAAYDLHDLVRRLGNTLPAEALKAEAARIVKRKRGQHGQADPANAELVKLVETLPENDEAAQAWGLAQFADELIITREFARAQGPNKQVSEEAA